MNFRQFLLNEEENNFSNLEIAHMYFDGDISVRELGSKTGKSTPEIYRIIRSYGSPNRINMERHNLARHLLSSGMGHHSVARFTNYTPRHILNIKNKYDNNI
jgi:hypothetical protein